MKSIRTVVVTGGSGRVGRYVVAELSERYEVVNADVRAGDGGGTYIKTDVMNVDEVRSALRHADAVCHLAGLDLDRGAAPGEYLRVNVLGTWNVLQIAAEQRLEHVVMASSVAASGLSEMRENWQPQALPVDERHESRPTHGYGLSKLMVEQMTRSFVHQTGGHATCLRLMSVISGETIDDYLKFIEAPGRRWLFYYVTAEDAARAFSAALLGQEEKYGEFFVSAMDSSRMEPTLDWYEERVGPVPPSVDDDYYRANPRASVFAYSAVCRALGWEPTSDFLELAEARRSRPDS